MAYVSKYRVAVFALCFMVVQNSTHTLLSRYSKGVRKDSYINSTNVLLAEVVKFFTCAIIMAWQSTTPVSVSYYTRMLQNSKVAFIPALTYFVQNVLAFVALSNLEAGVFAVLVQVCCFSSIFIFIFIFQIHFQYSKFISN